jgi:hypothetical protein
MTITFDHEQKTSKPGNNYWQVLRKQYDNVTSEIMFILRHVQGMTAEYIEKKPVPFRKKLVRDILDELEEKRDGSGAKPK